MSKYFKCIHIEIVEIIPSDIENLIYVVRNKQVMVDSDLAMLYQVETGALNRAVKRNIARFPEDFRFQLTKDEYENLKCQFGTSKLIKEKHVFHDRFLIFDRKTAYHVGASLKDSGFSAFLVVQICK